MVIKVNNEIRTYKTSPLLIDVLNIKYRSGVIVILNGRIICQNAWEYTYLNDCDDIQVIQGSL